MRIIRNRYIPLKGFEAINICGLLFARKGVDIDVNLLNHERIHTRQMKELLFVGFYLFYVGEWLCRLVQYKQLYKAYWNISFEREAYTNSHNPAYLQKRARYASFRYYLRKREKMLP